MYSNVGVEDFLNVSTNHLGDAEAKVVVRIALHEGRMRFSMETWPVLKVSLGCSLLR